MDYPHFFGSHQFNFCRRHMNAVGCQETVFQKAETVGKLYGRLAIGLHAILDFLLRLRQMHMDFGTQFVRLLLHFL